MASSPFAANPSVLDRLPLSLDFKTAAQLGYNNTNDTYVFVRGLPDGIAWFRHDPIDQTTSFTINVECWTRFSIYRVTEDKKVWFLSTSDPDLNTKENHTNVRRIVQYIISKPELWTQVKLDEQAYQEFEAGKTAVVVGGRSSKFKSRRIWKHRKHHKHHKSRHPNP